MNRSVCVTVWNWFREGLTEFNGGIVIPLNGLDIATVKRKWYQLKKSVV